MNRGVETEQFFLFYYTNPLACYIGKARLSTAQSAERRELMRVHLGERMSGQATRAA